MFSSAAPELFKLMLSVCSDLSSLLVHFFVTEHESEELQRAGWMFHVRVLQFNQLHICCSLVETHWRFIKWSQCQMKRIKDSYTLTPRGVICIPHLLLYLLSRVVLVILGYHRTLKGMSSGEVKTESRGNVVFKMWFIRSKPNRKSAILGQGQQLRTWTDGQTCGWSWCRVDVQSSVCHSSECADGRGWGFI